MVENLTKNLLFHCRESTKSLVLRRTTARVKMDSAKWCSRHGLFIGDKFAAGRIFRPYYVRFFDVSKTGLD
jgi:hypothetical protein